ncbi:MAG: M4 family metallopeptidase [Kofleriaceae bacterium]
MKTAAGMTTHRSLLRAALALAVWAGCESGAPTGDPKDDPAGVPSDVADALGALPEAQVLLSTTDGLPMYIVGEMGKVGAMQYEDALASDRALRPMLAPVLRPFRLTTSDLVLRKMNIDDQGGRHFRYQQQLGGLDVVGADLVVHVDDKGAIYSVNGSARGDIPAELGRSPVSVAAAHARIAGDGRFAGLAVTATRPVYLQTAEGALYKTYEAVVEGHRGQDPARDKVYVDQDSGAIVAVYPQIHFAENRRVYSANNSSSLPGTLKRTEGQAATTDTDVNAAYDNTGAAYEAYKSFWNRDSYDNAGATLTSSVHYSTNYCNAFWNSTQMVYGDGNASQNCLPLARSLDVTAHELTHAVTEHESNLVYSGEPGGINESFSDIFGAFVEAWVDGGKNGTLAVSANTWLVGELALPPALRYMCDPAADGISADVWSSSLGNIDVHYSSGPSNLMFCLLSKGGTHPRGKTTVTVPGIGMDKAIRILYKAQVDILTSTSNYAVLRTAAVQAATQLGYDQATQDAVACAFAAIKVGTAPASCGGTNPPDPQDGVLANNVPVTSISDSTGGQKFWKIDVPAGQTTLQFDISGGTGDADLYVQAGAKPSTTSYQCRPYKSGNTETCVITSPAAGTYWVMLDAYATYAGVTLKASYSATTSGDPYLTNGTAVTGLSGAAQSNQYWRIAAPGNRTVTVRISGGTGDADLYTRQGARPTTSSYACRPYAAGNSETCTHTNAAAGDWYVMLRGYSAYSGVSLVASW